MQKGKMRFIEVETKNRTADFINRLLTVWESSVRATHLFLSDSEIKKIKKYVPQALAGIAHLMIAEDDRGCPGAFMGIVRKHLAFEELTPTLLREMIEKIVVHECSYDENGTRRQDIEIYYSFVGKIDLPE